MTWADTLYILPEVILTIGACILLIAPLVGGRESGTIAKWSTLLLLAITATSVVYSFGAVQSIPQTANFARMFALDPFSVFFKMLFIAAVALVVLLSEDFLREERYSPWEYYSLLMFALTGMLFMASGVHLVSIWVGLELMSLSSYILAGYYKRETQSTEAAMKYFVLGATSSAILLYGVSLIYGVCGSLQLMDIHDALMRIGPSDALIFGIIML